MPLKKKTEGIEPPEPMRLPQRAQTSEPMAHAALEPMKPIFVGIPTGEAAPGHYGTVHFYQDKAFLSFNRYGHFEAALHIRDRMEEDGIGGPADWEALTRTFQRIKVNVYFAGPKCNFGVRVPFKDAATNERILRLFESGGIPKERVSFEEWV